MRATWISLSLLLLAPSFACDDDPEPAAETTPSPTPVPEPAPEPAAPTEELMAEHFRKAWQARDAIVRGDFDGAKAEVRWLAEHDQAGTIPPAVRSKLEPMQRAAREFIDSTSLSDAGTAYARMLDRCGDCHRAIETGPRFEPASPPEGEGTEVQMRRHRWAADRMWEGMVQPDPAAFARAAEVLAQTDLTPPDLGDSRANPERVQALVQHLHAMADEAKDAQNLEAREEAYGRFIASCAACHRLIGRGPGHDSEPSLATDLVAAPGR